MLGKTHDFMNTRSSRKWAAISTTLLGLLFASGIVDSGAAEAKKLTPVETAPIEVVPERAPVELIDLDSPVHTHTGEFGRYSYTLEELGAIGPIKLHSVDGRRDLFFSLRNDEVVTQARLRLQYGWSPALIPELSHLKVTLNDELMGTLPLPHENNVGQVSEVRLDPAMFIDFNKLTLGLIAHYTRECEDPMHSTLWANVSNQSKLDMVIRHLRLPDDLAYLPAPFFDRLDNRKLVLPFVFPSKPGNEVLHAAGVVASWFGGLASYRGTSFPVVVDSLPAGNSVVMVTGGAAPAGLELPPISGASLAVVTNPLNPNAKLLVVMGRDAKELDMAAQALTLGKPSLTGRLVSINSMKEVPARKPYDAPNWIPTGRAVNFGELAKPGELRAEGLGADYLRVNFNVPPDLFYWKSDGVPVNLNYRYTVRPRPDRSSLNVNINNAFVNALPLKSVEDAKVGKVKLPFLNNGKIAVRDEVLLPEEVMHGQNQLQFQYFFDYTKQGACKDVFLNNERGVIDQDSTIDFSSFPHYTALPNLGFFVNDGFPFTRMADLSKTAVIMPDNASTEDMVTYLNIMGRMGKVTGYPALRHTVTTAANVGENADKDLLVIGTAANQPLMKKWAANMHPMLKNGLHSLTLPGVFDRLKSRWDNRDLEDAMKRAGDLVSKGEHGLAALVAFESPLKSGRSVVAFTGDTTEQISTLSAALSDSKYIASFHGDLVLQSGKRIESFQMGPTYYVGELPWLMAMRWHLSNQPLALVLLVGIVSLLVAVIAFRYLRRLSRQRLAK